MVTLRFFVFFLIYTYFFVQSRRISSPFPNHSPCLAHGSSQINCVNVSLGLPGTLGVWTDAFIQNITFYSCQECKRYAIWKHKCWLDGIQTFGFIHSGRKLKRQSFPMSHSAKIHQCEPEALPQWFTVPQVREVTHSSSCRQFIVPQRPLGSRFRERCQPAKPSS